WLTEKRQIDTLCFQEIKCEEESFPFEVFRSMGYECVVNGQKRLNGVAICSKFPIKNVKRSFESEVLDSQKRLIEAEIGETVILNCYIPRGGLEGDEKHLYKMEFFDTLKEYAKDLLKMRKKVIILGDFNVALTNLDVYDPDIFKGAVGFLDSEKEKMKALLSLGLNDCYRRFHPIERSFTWWDYRTAGIWRDEGMRLDYILASETKCKECISVEVDLWTRRRRSPTPSDHAPVVAQFE
ncbi:MAG: exodeoxyribonuclease III, partial [Hydrogenimonas sp.]|nr:exodeoxyribonuclease III [Hydrogenimonas sp.]